MTWNEWLSVVAILISFIVFCLILFKRRDGLHTSKKKVGEFPDKKDLIYWLLIIISNGAWGYAFLSLDPATANSKLSLTATILSIALAIIAIFLSIVQSSDSSKGLLNITQKVSEVANEITKLNELKVEVSKSIESQAKLAAELASLLEGMKKTIDSEELKGKVDNELVAWKKVEKKMKSNHIDLPSTFFIRNAMHEKIVLDFLEVNGAVSFEKILGILSSINENYGVGNVHEMLTDMDDRKLIKMNYTNDNELIVEKAP